MEDSITGPFLQIAALCEQVLEEKTGVLSLIRIVDRLQVVIPTNSMGQAASPPPYTLTVIVSMRSGTARGSHELTIRPEAPNGMKQASFAVTVLFEGEDRGVNVVLPIPIQTDIEGLYWFDVLLDDKLLTRVPMRIVHQRVSFGFPPPQQ
jgi:hypothetical protein